MTTSHLSQHHPHPNFSWWPCLTLPRENWSNQKGHLYHIPHHTTPCPQWFPSYHQGWVSHSPETNRPPAPLSPTYLRDFVSSIIPSLQHHTFTLSIQVWSCTVHIKKLKGKIPALTPYLHTATTLFLALLHSETCWNSSHCHCLHILVSVLSSELCWAAAPLRFLAQTPACIPCPHPTQPLNGGQQFTRLSLLLTVNTLLVLLPTHSSVPGQVASCPALSPNPLNFSVC